MPIVYKLLRAIAFSVCILSVYVCSTIKQDLIFVDRLAGCMVEGFNVNLESIDKQNSLG